MIDRLLRVCNVGVFQNVSAHSDDFRFPAITLIHASNGSGKTTFASLLRSFAANDPNPIKERVTAGASAPPVVKIRLEGNTVAEFNHSAEQWSIESPPIFIFDDVFVETHVCSGLSVSLNNRRNLHSIIVGKRGVDLAQKVRNYDATARTHSRTAQDLANQIKPHIIGNLSVDDFCALPEQQNIQNQISRAESRLRTAQNAQAIKTQATFSNVRLPTIDAQRVDSILRKTLETLTNEAAARVRKRLSELPKDAEAWLARGVELLETEASATTTDSCPFCRQPTEHVDLISDFRGYFSSSYRELANEISAIRSQINSDLGGDSLHNVIDALRLEDKKREAWSSHTTVPKDEIPVVALQSKWIALRDALLDAIDTKLQSPLEHYELQSHHWDKLREFEKACDSVSGACKKLQETNPAIERIKADAESSDVEEAKQSVDHLKNAMARSASDVGPLCASYHHETKRRERVQKAKRLASEELEEHSRSVLQNYGKSINKHLADFGAGFQISEMSESREGGRAGASFQIVLNDTRIDIGRPDTPPGVPSFRNTLSGGDRTSLALAFFLAYVEHHAKLDDSVIVFDDPMSSLDGHRRYQTRSKIVQLEELSKQVIVLSHSPDFLRLIWDKVPKAGRNALEISNRSGKATIRSWDIETATESNYHQLRDLLIQFDRGEGVSDREVACAIRPMIEGYLRVVYPEHLQPGQWLGDFIHVARKGLDSGSPIIDSDDLRDLDDINDYSKQFHHNHRPLSSFPQINGTELLTHVRKSLSFTSRVVIGPVRDDDVLAPG